MYTKRKKISVKYPTRVDMVLNQMMNQPTRIDLEAWNVNYPIYPTPPLGQDMTQGQFLSGV